MFDKVLNTPLFPLSFTHPKSMLGKLLSRILIIKPGNILSMIKLGNILNIF